MVPVGKIILIAGAFSPTPSFRLLNEGEIPLVGFATSKRSRNAVVFHVRFLLRIAKANPRRKPPPFRSPKIKDENSSRFHSRCEGLPFFDVKTQSKCDLF